LFGRQKVKQTTHVWRNCIVLTNRPVRLTRVRYLQWTRTTAQMSAQSVTTSFPVLAVHTDDLQHKRLNCYRFHNFRLQFWRHKANDGVV